jgi:uncharacterized membrane protein
MKHANSESKRDHDTGYQKQRLKKMDIIHQWIYSHRFLILLGVITLIGVFLRFYHIGTESLWYDETASIYSAEKSIYVLLGGSLQWHRNPPLHFLALKYWIDLFGDSETAVRSLSAIFGIASIPLMFFLGRKLFSSRAGLIASFLVMISYFLIRFSQEGRNYSMLVFFTLLSFYFLVQIIQSHDIGKRHFVFYFITNTLLVYTHYYGLFVIAAQFFFFILARNQVMNTRRYFWYAQIATGVAFFPWALGVALISTPNSFSMGQPGLASLISTFRDYSGYGEMSTWLLLILGLFFILGLIGWKLFNTKNTEEKRIMEIKFINWKISLEWSVLLLLIWLIFPIILPFLISQIPTEIAGIYRSKYTISALPAFCLLASKGLDILLTKKFLYPIFIVTILVITIFSGIGLSGYYTTVQKEQWREAVNYIDPLFENSDAIVTNESYFSIPVEYYSKGELNTKAIRTGEEAREINLLVSNGKKRMWFIQGPWGSTSTREYLEENFHEKSLLLKQELVGVEVYLFELTSEVYIE